MICALPGSELAQDRNFFLGASKENHRLWARDWQYFLFMSMTCLKTFNHSLFLFSMYNYCSLLNHLNSG